MNTYIIDLKEFMLKREKLTYEEVQKVQTIFNFFKIDLEENTTLIFENIDSYSFGYILINILDIVGPSTEK